MTTVTRTSDVLLAVHVLLALTGLVVLGVGSWRGRGSWRAARAALVGALRDFAVFSGRATRSQFWWFAWWIVTLGVLTSLLTRALHGGDDAFRVVDALIGVLLVVPEAAVLSRRLHDVGRSGQWLWLSLTGVGVVLLLVWALLPSRPAVDRSGPAMDPGAPRAPGRMPADRTVTRRRLTACRAGGALALATAAAGSVLQVTSAVASGTNGLGSWLDVIGLIGLGVMATTCRPSALLSFPARLPAA